MTGQAFLEKNLKSRYFSIEKLEGLDTIDVSAEFRGASNKGYCQLTEAENHLIVAQVIAEHRRVSFGKIARQYSFAFSALKHTHC